MAHQSTVPTQPDPIKPTNPKRQDRPGPDPWGVAPSLRQFDVPPGTPLTGSRYVRDYCTRCGDPIRVSRLVWCGHRCEGCVGRPLPPAPVRVIGSERQYQGRYPFPA